MTTRVRGRLAVAVALVVLTLASLEGVRRCGFVGFDDDYLVYGNPHLRNGLSWAGVRWAFAADLLFDSPNADYWTPLTALSRLVDVDLFGMEPAGHHVTNLLLHAITVVLLFLVLDSMTGARGRSAFVAAVFACHPLHVESVAWVTERKDMLSGLLFTVTLGAYVRYARAPGPGRFAGVVAALAAGLLAKPMLLTTPFVLLLLDLWPLGRLRLEEPGAAARARRLLLEKWPLFLLTAGSVAATFVPLLRGGRLTSLESLPLSARVGNAILGYATYVGQMLWPHPLAIPYPHPGPPPAAAVLAAALILSAITGLCVRAARRRPPLLVGWLWFLGMLVPVVGLVQSGDHAHADRYMYLPSIGLALMLAWSVPAWAPRAWAAAGALGVAACVVATRTQVRYWQSTTTLFSHAVAVTKDNFVAHNNLAAGLTVTGDVAGAEQHYRAALAIRPRYREARTGLGVLLMRQGRLAEALEQQQQAYRAGPSAEVCFNLALVEARMGRVADALAHYAQAGAFAPAHYNRGNMLAAAGRWSEAEADFRAAALLRPDDVEAANNLGLSIGLQGRWEEATEVLRRASALDPDHVRVRFNLGRTLLALGRAEEARAQWEEAVRRRPHDPAIGDVQAELARLPSR
jgi:protein O-mannosyl-transferase